ncbi:helix-turn-helix domain-containing protein [Phyllobacterium myrsinacearum]|uniref:AraC-like DNA-binding protein n=1 Tax=Phyllobacterium myrsinacearum TaxID=28101 RepID=A0A839EI59_9HYPH|nr:AraC family transcriptional regulator [Phyllobacterium myrsinacearum]MBA8879993.1 AraC-like DNA-binding protein [Phyllobacterium myrsinacearum]
MTFQPRMSTKINGFSVVGGLQQRSWDGVVADLFSVDCAPDASGQYEARDPRLFIVLDGLKTGKFNVRLGAESKDLAGEGVTNPMCYVPAGMPLWARLDNVKHIRHIDLHFNVKSLVKRFGEDIDLTAITRPRLMFSDARILSLANLLAGECANNEPLHQLYGESLAIAVFSVLFDIKAKTERKRSRLAPWQLRRATDYMEAHWMQTIRLQELAELTGLSQSHFGHAFKASTGMPPHQWQMSIRIRRIEEMLLRTSHSLNHIAELAGFADQAHFTRVFRQHTGLTPAAWQRSQK